MGAYVVRTSSLNDKHSCQLFRIDASFSSVVLLSFFFCLQGQPELFASVHLLQSYVSLELIVVTSLQSFESGQVLFVVVFYLFIFIFISYHQPFFPLFFSIRSSVCFKFLIFLSERFFLAHAKAALLDFEHARVWSMLFCLCS